ncbi:isochorismatase family protein [Amaricoccus solimangrovi]|uniref:Isochorismatase family protein n=1 Tax=Amaricoccus solimangrovi TaxID=2589815 RepID=A0A501WRV4_9RHOB|nr:isochorismatase family protein [Amaricoccus solimangrovi]TPE52199.1 isochorismatase family protein [Amaricoccus solimangrovi]
MLLNARGSELLVIDVQPRLMAAIDQAAAMILNLTRLTRAARMLGVPARFAEQSPEKLGATLPELGARPEEVMEKATFDALATPSVAERLNLEATLVVAGAEAHVCVTQSVLDLLGRGAKVAVVADAVGSRAPANREAGLARMARHGAEIVTTEMVLFEWLGAATHPEFRAVTALIK